MVADRDGSWSDVSYEGDGTIKLQPNKKSYRPGETAAPPRSRPTGRTCRHHRAEHRAFGARRQRRGRGAVIEVPASRARANVCSTHLRPRQRDVHAGAEPARPARDLLLDLQIVPNKKEYRRARRPPTPCSRATATAAPRAGPKSLWRRGRIHLQHRARLERGHPRFLRPRSAPSAPSRSTTLLRYAGTKTVNSAQHKRANQRDLKNEADVVTRWAEDFQGHGLWHPALVTGPDGKATAKFERPTTSRRGARRPRRHGRHEGRVAVSKVVERKDFIIRVACRAS